MTDRRKYNSAFRDWALEKILAEKDHPLSFLVDREEQRWLGWQHLEDFPTVQVGHLTSLHAGAAERLALEDSEYNQKASWLGERQGAIFEKQAIEIGGIPVEKETAKFWERQGIEGFPGLPPGTVESAPYVAGWAPPGVVAGALGSEILPVPAAPLTNVPAPQGIIDKAADGLVEAGKSVVGAGEKLVEVGEGVVGTLAGAGIAVGGALLATGAAVLNAANEVKDAYEKALDQVTDGLPGTHDAETTSAPGEAHETGPGPDLGANDASQFEGSPDGGVSPPDASAVYTSSPTDAHDFTPDNANLTDQLGHDAVSNSQMNDYEASNMTYDPGIESGGSFITPAIDVDPGFYVADEGNYDPGFWISDPEEILSNYDPGMSTSGPDVSTIMGDNQSSGTVYHGHVGYDDGQMSYDPGHDASGGMSSDPGHDASGGMSYDPGHDANVSVDPGHDASGGMSYDPGHDASGGMSYDPGHDANVSVDPGHDASGGMSYDPGHDASGGMSYDPGHDANVSVNPGHDASGGMNYDPGHDASGGMSHDPGHDANVSVDPGHDASAGMSYDPGHDASGGMSHDPGHDANVSVDPGHDSGVASHDDPSGAMSYDPGGG